MDDKTTDSQTFKCAKCGKEKRKDDGIMIWDGTTFCCKMCCDKAQQDQTQEGVCEFC